MKRLILPTIVSALVLTGCSSTQQNQIVKDISNSTIDAVFGGSSSSTDNAVTDTRSTQKTSFYITEATVHSPDFGRVSVSKAKNPKGLTEVKIGKSIHLDSGGELGATMYLYPITSEGYIVDKPETFHRMSHLAVVNSGRYYVKAEASGNSLYASGYVDIERGVTNKVNLSFE
ncbi:hypothetical protein CW749_12690 [Vibrio sp. vnigr-6D03]|uniref:hypothetical protein n=1 Tax=Vibrio sp. vnigr-6D03 TaxID=2058088 RepID=UPI000C34A271|nr:hypothetical protein [Vibrio sp. vnigr-6D03]PKF79286.1 hypothetical protein CW749_12690 [Vibrio sp. vnigr-6D03]